MRQEETALKQTVIKPNFVVHDANRAICDVAEFACHQARRLTDIPGEARAAVEHGLRTGILAVPDGCTVLDLEFEVARLMVRHWRDGRWAGEFARSVPWMERQKRALN